MIAYEITKLIVICFVKVCLISASVAADLYDFAKSYNIDLATIL